MKDHIHYILVLVLVIFTLSSCDHKSKEIKLAHGLDTNHPVHKAMLYMAEELARKSDGEMTIRIYPNNQLGSERECVELLQVGILGMTKVSAAVKSSFSPDFQVLSFPYIFRDKDHFFKVQDSQLGKDLLLQSEKFWLRGLCFKPMEYNNRKILFTLASHLKLYL